MPLIIFGPLPRSPPPLRRATAFALSYPLTAIISDLHGNIPALEVALEDARARGVQRFICLGDVVGYGSRPRACLDLIMQLCADEPTDPKGEVKLELANGWTVQRARVSG